MILFFALKVVTCVGRICNSGALAPPSMITHILKLNQKEQKFSINDGSNTVDIKLRCNVECSTPLNAVEILRRRN